MGSKSAAELNAWLREGCPVVTASERAARGISAAYHQSRQSEGQSVWASPRVQDWQSFIRSIWVDRCSDGRLLLNPLQEQALWSDVIAASGYSAGLLEEPRRRLADLAMEAFDLLCLFAPHLLRRENRVAWPQDAGAFSEWLAAFNTRCIELAVVAPSRLELELIPQLENDVSPRPSLLLTGFDRLVPTQRKLLEAWGAWRELHTEVSMAKPDYYSASDQQTEIEACAQWCKLQHQADPKARLLVITSDVAKRRGQIERALLAAGGTASLPFEFSLGVPLRQIPLARSASALLRWLYAPLLEHEVDWLLSSPYIVTDPQETLSLQAYMRALRRRGLERTEWTLRSFLQQPSSPIRPPQSWIERMIAAQDQLPSKRVLSPLEWAEVVPTILRTAGWPGKTGLSSTEFQSLRRWQQSVETCGTLAFDSRRISFRDFLSELDRVLDKTLFTPESEDAPILIAGPTESAGLTADAIWFFGVDEDTWPTRSATHPLLPVEIQRAFQMPHASALLDWEFAQNITTRLMSSASRMYFSYAHQKDGVETRPTRLVIQLCRAIQPLPPHLQKTIPLGPLTVPSQDTLSVPFPQWVRGQDFDAIPIRGGSSVLSSQSQCPFKAFATARLDAQPWNPAEAGLTAATRGQLLHAVLHSIWAGPPAGIRTLEDLQAIADSGSFVSNHVRAVMREKLPPGAREQMPGRYLQLEERRLTALITEWLRYEEGRQPFSVHETEVEATANIAGLSLKLRLDRVDLLNDNTLLVIDYKTGDVSPKSWVLPRPDDVQLPLYAGFALPPDQELGGLVFAKVRAGETCFAGHVGNPVGTLRADLKGNASLARNPLTAEQLMAWRDSIEQLARDFLAGRAQVDPREYPQTCERCGLQTLCRIQERELFVAGDEEFAGADRD